jgi:uncharacterized protein
MRWAGRRGSGNVEDRRGMSPRMAVGGGLGLVITIIALLLGQNPDVIGNLVPNTSTQAPAEGDYVGTAEEEQQKQFVSVVLADTEDTWRELFQQMGRTYQEPTLVLFSGAVDSGCGFAQSASGPFYCPRDHKLYLDTSFFDQLSRGFGAPGDFAQAYVIAHEVGHHVQNQLGILPRVEAMQGQVSRADANRVQVLVELQADCFAGIWAHHADRSRGLLESGDIEEGLNAAAAIGDDRLQKRSQGYVVPDAFTHGSSAQRVGWFKRGLQQGTPEACDTFSRE